MAFHMLGIKPYLTVLNVKTFAKFSFFSHAIYMLLVVKGFFHETSDNTHQRIIRNSC